MNKGWKYFSLKLLLLTLALALIAASEFNQAFAGTLRILIIAVRLLPKLKKEKKMKTNQPHSRIGDCGMKPPSSEIRNQKLNKEKTMKTYQSWKNLGLNIMFALFAASIIFIFCSNYSIAFEPTCKIILYEHGGYHGNWIDFTADDSDFGDNTFGSWPWPWNWHDKASSIRVHGGCKAVLYEHGNYGGASITFTKDDPNFGDDVFGYDWLGKPIPWHDKASSIRVYFPNLNVDKNSLNFGDLYRSDIVGAENYNKKQTRTFKITNDGDLDTTLHWKIEVPKDVIISPTSGELGYDKSETITVWVNPPGSSSTFDGTFTVQSNGGTNTVSLTAQVCGLPTVNDTPPQAAITAGTVDWYNDGKRYFGVTGKLVKLMADGVTSTGDNINKYLWDLDLDGDWDQGTVKEQSANDVLEHTWNNSSLSSKIRCKAETDYGIESKEKSFDLRIYDSLKVDPDGSYTGKPNSPVELKGSIINPASYPDASFQYQWGVQKSSDSLYEDVETYSNGRAVFTEWDSDTYNVKFTATVTTVEGLELTGSASTTVTIEAGKPIAKHGGPYRGGIEGGNFSPIQFEGNHPDFLEPEDVGKITGWEWSFFSKSLQFVGKSLQFDGVDDYVKLSKPLPIFSSSFTVSMWVNVPHDVEGRVGVLLGDYDLPGGTKINFEIHGRGQLRLYWDGQDIFGKQDLRGGGWHFITFVRDKDNQKVYGYIDGKIDFEYLGAISDKEASIPHYIGRDSREGNTAFNGLIDEVAIFDRALESGEIQTLRDNPPSGKEPGLVGYWNFDEDIGTMANDQSGNGNNGTLYGPQRVLSAVDANVWNPTHAFPKAGEYNVGLIVKSEHEKWSTVATTTVEVIDGKITGYVRAADLRTPVKGVQLTLTSSHVDKNVLASIAVSDTTLSTTGEGEIYAETNEKGYYVFEHIPLGSYKIVASKKDGQAHEFETNPKVTELVLNAPNQLTIDFVDLSVFSVGGRIVYSIKKNDNDVMVEGVEVRAQPVGVSNLIEGLPSTKSLSSTNTNYSIPLLASKYLFLAKKEGHYVRLAGTHPDDPADDPDRKAPYGYNNANGLITIEEARTDINFIDYTTRKLTVFVKDSGGYAISTYPETGSIMVTVSGENGQVSDQLVSEQSDEEGTIIATTITVTLNPGKYTVTVPGAEPETEDVDLTAGDREVTMTIPVPIELEIISNPPMLLKDLPEDFVNQAFDTDTLKTQLSIEGQLSKTVGYMIYYPPKPQKHTYTIRATANGHPVGNFTLFIKDEISMMTEDPPEEKEVPPVVSANGEFQYTITAGFPKRNVENNLAEPKKISFRAESKGYKDSNPAEDEVTVLGDVAVGTAAQIVSIPVLNYFVLHDPPGDGSYAYLDDSMTLKGIVFNMKLWDWYAIGKGEIPVYPSPWTDERSIGLISGEKDLGDKGLLGYKGWPERLSAFSWFTTAAVLESVSGVVVVALGPVGYVIQFVKMPVYMVAMKFGVQYEVSPNRRIETPSGDELPDLVGPGKGDIYFGEGWTLGFQEKYRLGIVWNATDEKWDLATEVIMTYDILERTNQYIYTIRDIENIIDNLNTTGENITFPDVAKDTPEFSKRINEITTAKDNWENLLNKNLAYKWNQNLKKDRKSFEKFSAENKLTTDEYETLMFSAGPTFEYSRTIKEGKIHTYSSEVSVGTDAKYSHELKTKVGFDFFGSGTDLEFKFGAEAAINTGVSYGNEFESGVETEQTVGFVLNDDDIGDNIATRVYADPVWGTPLFFQEPGSVTSDPWEVGTNKAVDVTMELLPEPSGYFDYHDGAHYKIKVNYAGQRELESAGIGFLLYASPTDNPDNMTVRFNGNEGPYGVELSKQSPSATIAVSVYPPEVDMANSEEKEYPVVIAVEEEEDGQIGRELSINTRFADLRAPRATIIAPYSGQRISPVFFPKDDPLKEDNPFKIEVVSEDTDLTKIQLQIRSKQPDGVWEPWRNLSDDMVWEDRGTNENVTVFDRLDRRPPRREFTFKWAESEIGNLGVGEYALRAVATDKATRSSLPDFSGNTDLDPPSVVFLVDDAKPSVLNSIPDYQARESERIYHGELSVTFTDDMRSTDFDDRTFYVMDMLDNNKKVAGYVSYSPALRKAVFVPIVPFQPNGFYRVQIKTDVDTDGDGDMDERGVHDLAGNPLDNAFVWTFRTTDAPFEPVWSMNFRVTDGTATDANNIAGVAYGATDAEDEKDARTVPAMASQMRMSFLNRAEVEFDRDIRPADGRLAHHWFFVIDNAQVGSTVTLYWQPSVGLTKTTRQYQIIRLTEFYNSGNVKNVITLDPTLAGVDPDTGEVEAYTYNNQTKDSRYFRLDVQKIGFVAEEFKKGTSGWKFFSAPITPQRAEPFVNLGDDIDPFQLYQYDTQLGGYKIYPFDIGEVGLQTGHGYFTRLEKLDQGDGVYVDVGGTMNRDPVTLTLEATGWYAIGNPFIKEVDIGSLKLNDGSGEKWFNEAVAAGWVEGTLYRWATVTNNADKTKFDSYEEVVNVLKPWEGYWLKKTTTQANLTLTIPAPLDLPDQVPTPPYLIPPMAPVMTPPVVSGSRPATDKGEFELFFAVVSDDSSDMTTTLGTRQGAQAEWDVFDRSEPPTLSKTVAAYFNHLDWGDDSGLYNRDYQPALKVGEQQIWKFTVYTDKQDAKMALSWEKAIAQVPDDIMLYFRRADLTPSLSASGEGESSWQDMRKVQSVDLISHSRITEIPFEVRAKRFEMSPPSDVQVIAGEKQVLLRWKADDNPFIDGYTIDRQDTNSIRRFVVGEASEHSSRFKNEFLDTDVAEEATYTYQVTVHFKSGAKLQSEQFTVTVLPVIKKTALLPCYPNPFNPDVWIPYELEKETAIKIEIYNAAGQLVRTLDLGAQPRGRYISKSKAAYWDGRNEYGERAASGVYFYALKAGNFTATRKMAILK